MGGNGSCPGTLVSHPCESHHLPSLPHAGSSFYLLELSSLLHQPRVWLRLNIARPRALGSGYGHEAVPCRRLLIHILHAFYSLGWHLVMATDMSKKGFDMIFKPGPPVQRYFFAISFNETDKIRLIDSPNPHVLCDFIAAVQVGPQSVYLIYLRTLATRERCASLTQINLDLATWDPGLEGEGAELPPHEVEGEPVVDE